MEFCIETVLGTNANTSNAVAMVTLSNAQPASVECAGAGAVLIPLSIGEDKNDSTISVGAHGESSGDSRTLNNGLCERFYYRAPKPVSSESAASSSPKGSPESPGTSPGSHRLVRVNKAGCVTANSNSSMVAVGESSGYLPRLLLYDLISGECLSVLKDQHQFGVQHLRFSPSGHYLASLGTPQDGFLYIWSTTNGQLELKSSNKCISEIRDITWLNDSQLVTSGVRHIKLWTVGSESILSGRNILLKETLDQTFECACPAYGPLNGGLVVGTARGEVYKMPEIQHLATIVPAQPIKSIIVMDSPFTHVFVSTQNHIYEFRDTLDACHKIYPYGTAALLPFGQDIYFLSQDSYGKRVMRLPTSPNVPAVAHKGTSKPLDYKGVQLSSNSEGKVVLWRTNESFICRWPNTHLETPISNITMAYELTGYQGLMVGSLCGDLWLGGELLNAHNGPITDAHQLGRIAVTSGRDRCVQIWLRSELDESGISSWQLAQTLMFTSPILKAKLCIRDDGAYALVCCAANKTAYCYNAATLSSEAEGPIFKGSPKSLLLKGMPFDLASLEESVLVSTNDKHISVLDPFAEEKLKLRWRVYNANMESVNATHMQIIVHDDKRYVLVAGSDKCVHLFSYPKGELVASQWGHGEPISGIAWTGSEVLSAGDSVLVSSIKASETPRVGRPRSSTYTEPQSPSLPRFVIPSDNQTISTRESSPPRKVYNASPPPRPRSVSPQRMTVPSRTLARSPSPTREKIQPTRLPESAATSLNVREKDSEKQPSLSYKPLRLATPTSQARNVTVPNTANQVRQDPTANLVSALQQFIDQPLSQHDTIKLKSLLVSALNKVDGFSLAEEFGERICGSVETRVEKHLANLLKRQ